MEFLFNVIVVLHFVGLALLLGAFLVQVNSPEKTVTRWMCRRGSKCGSGHQRGAATSSVGRTGTWQ